MRTYFLTRLRHEILSPYQILFSILMPILMFNIFGHSEGSDYMLPTGANASGIIVIQMAFYSAILASTMSGSMLAHERETQWTRTLYLAGASVPMLVLSRFAVSLCMSVIPTTLLYIIAACTGAILPTRWWIITWILIVVISTLFSGFGQYIGSIFPDRTAGGLASGLIVLLAFMSDIFVPLEGFMFRCAQFMPLFGFKSALTWELISGHNATGEQLNLAFVSANIAVWSLIMLTLSVVAVRLSRRR